MNVFPGPPSRREHDPGAEVGKETDRPSSPHRYQITVKGALPEDLSERVSAIHATAIALKRMGGPTERRRRPRNTRDAESD